MKYISLPEKCVKLELRKEYHSSFHLNDENIIIQPFEKYLYHILNQIKKYKPKSKSKKNIISNITAIENSWLVKYYKIIEGRQSSFSSRFLGKELLYKRLLLHNLIPQNNLLGVDTFIEKFIEDSDYPYIIDLLKILSQYKEDVIFISKHFKSIKESIKLTPLEYHQALILAFPFELHSYKFWIKNVMLYNIHKELTIT